jgi:hypothetical protein
MLKQSSIAYVDIHNCISEGLRVVAVAAEVYNMVEKKLGVSTSSLQLVLLPDTVMRDMSTLRPTLWEMEARLWELEEAMHLDVPLPPSMQRFVAVCDEPGPRGVDVLLRAELEGTLAAVQCIKEPEKTPAPTGMWTSTWL